jgi:hypothetical protein
MDATPPRASVRRGRSPTAAPIGRPRRPAFAQAATGLLAADLRLRSLLRGLQGGEFKNNMQYRDFCFFVDISPDEVSAQGCPSLKCTSNNSGTFTHQGFMFSLFQKMAADMWGSKCHHRKHSDNTSNDQDKQIIPVYK